MRWTVKTLGTGVLGVGLGLGPCGAALLAQNSVPDAPKPQTLPQLNTITPAAPAVPNAPVPSAPTPKVPASSVDPAAAANGGYIPGTTLPGAAGNGVPASSSDTGTADNSVDAAGSSTEPMRHADSIRVQTNFVEVPFTVKDTKGSLVPGLTYRDIRVYENGQPQSVRLFTVDPTPLSAAIVIDQSVTFDTMQKINASLEALQSSFAPFDEVSIYTYNNGVKEQTGFSGAQSARVTYALQRSKSEGRDPMMYMGGPLSQTTVKNNLPVDPNTNRGPAGVLTQNVPREYHTLNDAILTAAVGVAKAGKGRRRVIYVISDGKEYGSQAKEKEVIRFLQTNQIGVYATLVGDTSIPGVEFLDKFHLPFEMKDNVLPRYASATGGDYFGAFRPRAIENSFAKLSEEVRTQYVAGYYSHEPFIDGKFRPYEVRVMRPNLDVIAPKGYYPNASDAVGGGAAPGTRTSPAPAAPAGAANASTTP